MDFLLAAITAIRMSDASPASTPAKGPARPNFPLPRTLRDRIYRYLLDAEYVKVTSDVRRQYHEFRNFGTAGTDSTAHGYRFHTSILGVNRAVYNEAMAVLYRTNTFILVSNNCPGFEHKTPDRRYPCRHNSRRSPFRASFCTPPSDMEKPTTQKKMHRRRF
ncbi:hypothetical protein M8818_003298 [Zalaria obscura]|uniref:Uncharacterized protein n=1 Tax=Zalaria obscura TaxID=2024903 RepID=A0ACC3SF80_9PEZI